VHVGVVRLPQVHDTRKQGLVTKVIQIAREKGVSAYVGDGANRWTAAPLRDVAHLYRLAVEKTGPGVTTYHAVQEERVSLRDIAKTIGKGLKVPVVSIPVEKAGEHFGPFFGYAATQDMPASSEWTRKTLGWDPAGPGLIEDLSNRKYCRFLLDLTSAAAADGFCTQAAFRRCRSIEAVRSLKELGHLNH
jgi:nucleoside-diphosphate-sugar epimerase